MKGAVALAIGMMLTVDQRDASRTMNEHSSVAVSADGRFVAFTTYSRLVPADTDTSSDVYVLDRHTRRVTLESADTAVDGGDVSYPRISGDGRYVVFERAERVMVRDRNESVTKIVGEGRQPAIASNGQLVAYAAGTHPAVAEADVSGERTDIYVTGVQSGVRVRPRHEHNFARERRHRAIPRMPATKRTTSICILSSEPQNNRATVL